MGHHLFNYISSRMASYDINKIKYTLFLSKIILDFNVNALSL